VCLKYAFTSKEDLFLILDLMRGGGCARAMASVVQGLAGGLSVVVWCGCFVVGDLAFHLDKRGRFTMEEARYFAARTLLGLQHLHKNGIVYR
jgi:serine/threonine protein kinase